jgi:hypothetical protein
MDSKKKKKKDKPSQAKPGSWLEPWLAPSLGYISLYGTFFASSHGCVVTSHHVGVALHWRWCQGHPSSASLVLCIIVSVPPCHRGVGSASGHGSASGRWVCIGASGLRRDVGLRRGVGSASGRGSASGHRVCIRTWVCVGASGLCRDVGLRRGVRSASGHGSALGCRVCVRTWVCIGVLGLHRGVGLHLGVGSASGHGSVLGRRVCVGMWVLKPAAALGFGPSSVRREGEPARWPGRVLLRPDSDLSWFVSGPID